MRRKLLFHIVLPLLLISSAESFGYDVAVLKSAEIKPYQEALEGFSDTCGCRIIEVPHPTADRADIADQVRAMHPDAVLVIGLDAYDHLSRLTDIPVIYAMIQSFRPGSGRNISGVNMHVSPERSVSSLIELFPSAKKIGVIYDPLSSEPFVHESIQHARARGLDVLALKAAKPGEVPRLLEEMKGRIDVFWMLPDPAVVTPETVKAMMLFSFQSRTPVFTFTKKYVEMGAVAALYVSPHELGKEAGDLSARILNGASKYPVRVTAKKPALVINAKIAQKIGIRFRDEVARKAEYVD